MKILADNLNRPPRQRLQLREVFVGTKTSYVIVRLLQTGEITKGQYDTKRSALKAYRMMAQVECNQAKEET